MGVQRPNRSSGMMSQRARACGCIFFCLRKRTYLSTCGCYAAWMDVLVAFACVAPVIPTIYYELCRYSIIILSESMASNTTSRRIHLMESVQQIHSLNVSAFTSNHPVGQVDTSSIE